MFHNELVGTIAAMSFPRIRGDVPTLGYGIWILPPFSPHTRGCSSTTALYPGSAAVFPAYAGMFLWDGIREKTRKRFPRIRGDVPAGTDR